MGIHKCRNENVRVMAKGCIKNAPMPVSGLRTAAPHSMMLIVKGTRQSRMFPHSDAKPLHATPTPSTYSVPNTLIMSRWNIAVVVGDEPWQVLD